MSMWDVDTSTPASVGNGNTAAQSNGGFVVGRGRGFSNVNRFSEVGQNNYSSNNNNDDCGWDDSLDSGANQTSSYSNGGGSRSYGGGGGGRSGGSNKCFKCNEEGHMSRDCPTGGRSGGGGGGACYKCNETGHMARECPNSDSGGGRGRSGGSNECYKCHETGHMARECPNSESSGGRGGGSGECYKCHETGHMARDCPNSNSGGGRGGSNECYKCHETGHMARDCPNSDSGGGRGGSNECYKCHEVGHMARDCPNSESGGGGDRTCRKCNEVGHFARECPNSAGGGGGGSACFKCKEEGHMARDCTKEILGEDGKPRPPPYIPPEPEADSEKLFESIPSGINFDKHDKIHVDVSGKDKPSPIRSFEESGLNGHLLRNVERSKYTRPTPVQKYSIPIVLAGRDLMACAQTGSGKTAAFLLPIINQLITDPSLPNNADNRCQEPLALIVAPTRELIIQIGQEARKFANDSIIKTDILYGGTSTMHQAKRIQRGCHILAATPGRLLDFLEKGMVSFSGLRFLVLDEADRMLDMGFAPAIRKMVEHQSMPQLGVRQTLMFSATFPEEIQKLAGEFLHEYLFLTVGMVGAANTDVEQSIFNVGQFEKKAKLLEILQESGTDRTLVFVEKKRTADFIASFCSTNQIMTTSIHGDRLQREREEALRDFKTGRMPVLVATAVAARGLDIRDVLHVVNFDLPSTIDEYVHRIGRTGRVGNTGRATSFYDSEQDQQLARALKKILIDAEQIIPDWLSEEANNGGDSSSYSKGFNSRDVRGSARRNADDAFNNFSNGGAVEEESWG